MHCGTNDLEHISDPKVIAQEIYRIISLSAKKFPSATVLFSTLLPRSDHFNDTIKSVNRLVSQNCASMSNVHITVHSNVNNATRTILHDRKHLNRSGASLFARNLTRAVYKGVLSPMAVENHESSENRRNDQKQTSVTGRRPLYGDILRNDSGHINHNKGWHATYNKYHQTRIAQGAPHQRHSHLHENLPSQDQFVLRRLQPTNPQLVFHDGTDRTSPLTLTSEQLNTIQSMVSHNG